MYPDSLADAYLTFDVPDISVVIFKDSYMVSNSDAGRGSAQLVAKLILLPLVEISSKDCHSESFILNDVLVFSAYFVCVSRKRTPKKNVFETSNPTDLIHPINPYI